MLNQFLHNLQDSFRVWFENELLQEGSGYRNVTSGMLYKMSDPRMPHKSTYSSPYGQIVYDQSISGAFVPSGVFSGASNTFVQRGSGGLSLDFERGRAIFNSGIDGTFKANYAVKDFNIYFTTQPDAKLLFENKINFRPRFYIPPSGADPNATYGPLIYIKRDYAVNEPWALGGQDNSCSYFRAIVLSDNEWEIDAVGSIFMDAARKNFPLLPSPPLNRSGDLRTGDYYNYLEDVNTNYNSSNVVHIASVDYYRFDAKTEVSLSPSFYAGFIEFQCELPRFPRL
jgi:hypothetical protein